MDELIEAEEKLYRTRQIVRVMRWWAYDTVIAVIMVQCDVDEDDAEAYYEDAMTSIAYEEANGL